MTGSSKSGKLIVFEGPDGTGKSTVSRLVADSLVEYGEEIVYLSFPGREAGTVGDVVYRLHHDEMRLARAPSPLALQAMHIAAHIDTIEGQIIPELKLGKIVILDRYWWSTWVYGLVAGCDISALRRLIKAELAVWGTFKPALVMLLQRSSPIDRSDPLAYWQNLAREYEALRAREGTKYPTRGLENIGSLRKTVDVALKMLMEHRALAFSNKPRLSSRVGMKELQGKRTPSHLLPLKSTAVYDSLWRFAAERQEIFFKRLSRASPPWTDDPILAEYKFTNAFRASDRTSQYLIRNVLYHPELSSGPEEVFFRCLVFKIFNRIETWQALEKELGAITLKDFRVDKYTSILSGLMKAGQSIYSAAYIMPIGLKLPAPVKKHATHLALLDRMIRDRVSTRLGETRTMQQAFEMIRSYPGMGDFLAFQYAIDLNYSEIMNFNESDFVVAGPGAIDGIRKCFTDLGGLSVVETMKLVCDRQDLEFKRLGLEFKTLWGRRLMLIDIQNLFCEVGKYARIRHPEYSGVSGRTRIKQKLTPRVDFPAPWYPPKWKINLQIESWLNVHAGRYIQTSD